MARGSFFLSPSSVYGTDTYNEDGTRYVKEMGWQQFQAYEVLPGGTRTFLGQFTTFKAAAEAAGL